MENPVNNIKKNYILNTFYQILTILTPLITTPYISRVIGPAGIGEFSYTNSIVSYLVLFGTLGLTAYASRQMAYCQEDRIQQTKTFNEVISLKIICIIPGIIILTVLAICSERYRFLLLAQEMYVLDAALNIDWLYVGNENFKVTVARNTLIKILSILLIFIFVKEAEDLITYVFILAGSALLGGLSLWIGAGKYINRLYFSLDRFKLHLRGGLSLFLIQIAWSIYSYLDKIMIGILQDDISQNGYYEQSQKIIVLSTTIITSLSTVMLPRISNSFVKKDKDKIEKYMNATMKFAICLGTALSVGLTVCAPNIVPWFFGDEFYDCITILQILAPVILFNSLYNMLGYQYLLGTKQEGAMTKSIIVGSAANVLLNVIFIPIAGAKGASIASLIAQIIIVLIQFFYVSRQVNFIKMGNYIGKCIIAGVIMYMLLKIASYHLNSGIWESCLMIVMGAIIYFIMLAFLKEDFIIIEGKLYIRRMLKRGKN